MALSGLEERIRASIAGRREEMVRDLSRLVAIPTGGGNAAGLDECRGVLTARLVNLGAKVELVAGHAKPAWLLGGEVGGGGAGVPPTAVCRRGDRAKLLLCGHIDTVHDPRGAFRQLTVEGAKATGPGCMDMKGGILVAVVALEALAAAGVDVPWSFVLNSDEETGSFHSDKAIRMEAARVAAGGGVAGLVFEPALPDGGLVVERPGSGQFVISAKGKAAHVGRDFTAGVNAIYAVAQRAVLCGKLAAPARGKIVTIGVMKGGKATNIVPDEATAWGNVRFGSAEVEAELAHELDALADERGLEATPPRPQVTVKRDFSRPAKPMTAAVKALAEQAKKAAEDLGQTLPFGKTGGVCDGNNIQAAGLAVIDTLGVRGGGAHTEQEWVELASLTERATLAAVLISRLVGA